MYSDRACDQVEQAGRSAPDAKSIREVSPEHALVKKLDDEARVDDLAQVFFDGPAA